jgi:hypothetical protein
VVHRKRLLRVDVSIDASRQKDFVNYTIANNGWAGRLRQSILDRIDINGYRDRDLDRKWLRLWCLNDFWFGFWFDYFFYYNFLNRRLNRLWGRGN